MRIEIHGQQLTVTAALRDYVATKFSRLQRHFVQPFEVRTQHQQRRTESLARISETG